MLFSDVSQGYVSCFKDAYMFYWKTNKKEPFKTH